MERGETPLRLGQAEKIAQAVLFASGEPVSAPRLAQVLGCETPAAYGVLDRLREYYEAEQGALQVLVLGDGYQLCTRREDGEYIRSALEIRRNQPLSQAALETLAVIAYNQPVTKSFVEQVRGVDSSSVVNTLVEKGLVEEAGRMELPGRPVAYVTTSQFLRCFQLSDLSELPPVVEEGENGQLEGQIELSQVMGGEGK